MPSQQFIQLVERASSDPAFRGRVIWFPDQVCDEYRLAGDEAAAVSKGDVSALSLGGEIGRLAARVFDLHDMYSGE